MIDTQHLAAYFLAALVLAVVPGPGLLYVAARTIGRGRRDGLASTLGTAAGGCVHVVAAATGLSAIIATSATAFAVVKYAGAAYLVVLGVRMLVRRSDHQSGTDIGPTDRRGSGFRQGVLTEALNPKTAVFFLAFVPHFLDPAAGSVLWQALLLGGLSVLLNSLADVVVVVLAGHVHARLAGAGRTPRWPRLASGSALVALGGYVAVES